MTELIEIRRFAQVHARSRGKEARYAGIGRVGGEWHEDGGGGFSIYSEYERFGLSDVGRTAEGIVVERRHVSVNVAVSPLVSISIKKSVQ